jgi:hypothetical protein
MPAENVASAGAPEAGGGKRARVMMIKESAMP